MFATVVPRQSIVASDIKSLLLTRRMSRRGGLSVQVLQSLCFCDFARTNAETGKSLGLYVQVNDLDALKNVSFF